MSLNFGEFVAVGSMSAAVNMVPMCNANHFGGILHHLLLFVSSTTSASESKRTSRTEIFEREQKKTS